MTGSIRNFEKLNFTPKSSVFCFSQGQTSKYDRLAHSHDVVKTPRSAIKTLCNIRLLQSHMRLKKNRPYNHWLKSQGHYLLCFSTSRTVGANSVRLRHETGTRYSLKATTKIPPPPTLEIKTSPYLGLEIPKIHERR